MPPSQRIHGSKTLQHRSNDEMFVVRPPTTANGQSSIRRLLIANRGEIACRIISTCKLVGITSISVFTNEDRDSLHIRAADESICIGSIDQPDGNPHQNAELLVKTAISSNADAVHPGYGYLSENADFAKAVRDANLIFVGPSPESISILGDKRQAKDFLLKSAPQVPLIPGYSGSTEDIQELQRQAANIGYPILIKAAAGGGGRGLRVVHDKAALQGELSRAQSEAQRSFGSSDCLLEKYIQRGKHIEIQIVGDSGGEVFSLFDRECSVQRRYQKIVEEAPSPWLPDTLRKQMMDTARAIGKSMQYENAGTVEFIVDIDTESYYFLEVNTRIQVEHAITEETTGIDIVGLQLYVAGGGRLADCQPLVDVSQSGHSIECRVCAENPAQDFMPDSGLILRWTSGKDLLDPRQAAGVRVETAVETGSRVSTYFDSMIAKIIVKDVDRPSAISKMLNVLQNTVCVGIKTNLSFLQACLAHSDFLRVDYTTSFLLERTQDLLRSSSTRTIPATLQTYCFVPALFARSIANRSKDASAYRPFRSIRSGFRNQTFDRNNTIADVITSSDADPSRTDPNTTLLTWIPKRDAPESTFYYHQQRISLPEKTSSNENEKENDVGTSVELISHYNEAFISHQKAPEVDSKENSVRIVDFNASEQASGSLQWLVGDMSIEIDGKTHHFHLTTDTQFKSKGSGKPQRVFLHTTEMGDSVPFSRHTLLSYGESLREKFGAGDVVDELRQYKSFMPCKVLRILKEKGDAVAKGETMLVVESMKTEMKIIANTDGTFEPRVAEGDAIDAGVPLCEIV